MMTACLLGSILVLDIAHPRPADVDPRFLILRLAEMRRFSGNPAALTVAEHQTFCALLADDMGMSEPAVEWAGHHDDHEFATGDMVSPLQRAIGTEQLPVVQQRWDVAIARRLGLREPTGSVRAEVARVDRIALGVEWMICLGRKLDELGVAVEGGPLGRASRILVEAVLTDDRWEEIGEGREFLKMGVAG